MRTRFLSSVVMALAASWHVTAAAQTEADLFTACNNYWSNYLVSPPECTWEVNFGAHTQFPNVCGTVTNTCIGGPNAGTSCSMDYQCHDMATGDGHCDSVPVRVELSYPTEPNPGVTYTPAVFMHGGGVDPGYRDIHEQAFGSSPYEYPSHPVNPYQGIVRRLVAKGMVVAQPIFPSTDAPQIMANRAAEAVRCMMERMDSDLCVGNSTRPCFTPLVDRVAWKQNGKQEIVYVAHSSGGVAALYMPQQLGYALRGLVLIDPAKDDLWLNNPPETIYSKTPIVHLYPDYYGPLSRNGMNSLMNIGTSSFVTGPWIPLGIRDYPANDCNPDVKKCVGGPTAGANCADASTCGGGTCEACHEAHHCLSMGNDNSHEAQSTQCGAWCGAGVKFCGSTAPQAYKGLPCTSDANCGSVGGSCVTCTKSMGTGCPAGQVCGQGSKCRENANLKPNTGNQHVWKYHRANGSGASATTILARYVIAYAGCYGAMKGANLQPWITGVQRDRDDVGFGGEPGDPYGCVTKSGNWSSYCSSWTSQPICEYQGCFWAKNAERTCAGGTNVGLPCSGDGNECPGSSCGIKRCFMGPTPGLPCSNNNDCGTNGYCKGRGSVIRIHNSEVSRDYSTGGADRFYGTNTTVPWEYGTAGGVTAPGSFKERQEKINWWEGEPLYVKCSNGPGAW